MGRIGTPRQCGTHRSHSSERSLCPTNWNPPPVRRVGHHDATRWCHHHPPARPDRFPVQPRSAVYPLPRGSVYPTVCQVGSRVQGSRPYGQIRWSCWPQYCPLSPVHIHLVTFEACLPASGAALTPSSCFQISRQGFSALRPHNQNYLDIFACRSYRDQYFYLDDSN